MAFRRDEDFAAWLKNNWWLVIVLFVGIIVWINSSRMPETGSDSVAIPKAGKNAGEQSLRSLDSTENPQGAPGSSLGLEMPSQGSSAGKDSEPQQISSLFQAPGGAAGMPLTGDQTVSGSAVPGTGADTLAAALKRVGDSTSRSSERGAHGGWGDQAVHTGFSTPRARFGQLPSRAGGASSSASSTIEKPFGLGGNPGLVESRAPDLKDAKVSTRLGRMGVNEGSQSLQALKGVEKAASSSLAGNTERAAGIGQKTFDAAGSQSKSIAGGPGSAAGVGMQDGMDVPANLKGTDFGAISKKEFTPPPVGASAAVTSANNNNQMMMMMMMMMMMGPVLGPSFSAMAPAMMMGMTMAQSAPK